MVRVDSEAVVARAAMGEQRCVRAGTEEATGGCDYIRKGILWQQTAIDLVALQPEDLADLDAVVALTAVERYGHRRIVGEEGVVTAEAFDRQPPVQRSVVVDALDLGSGLVAGGDIAVGFDIAMDHRNIAGPVCLFTG